MHLLISINCSNSERSIMPWDHFVRTRTEVSSHHIDDNNETTCFNVDVQCMKGDCEMGFGHWKHIHSTLSPHKVTVEWIVLDGSPEKNQIHTRIKIVKRITHSSRIDSLKDNWDVLWMKSLISSESIISLVPSSCALNIIFYICLHIMVTRFS